MKTPWIMSIRAKIVSGCILLTFVTLFVGVLSQRSQVQLSDTTRQIYDNAFISMSYLRSAQAIVLAISGDRSSEQKSNAVYIDQLQSALDALSVARERAMSTRGEACARQLLTSVESLERDLEQGGNPPTAEQFREVERMFDTAVQIYASDGLRFRNSVEMLVGRTRTQTYLAMFGSIAIAIVIAFVLIRAIVPSIRNSVKVATSIAAGKLDNVIPTGGSTETAILFTALATMQESIAEKISFIETLMNNQASRHAAQIAVQHARFEAALDNMTMGLCMFDADGTLLVHNRRFTEMFAQGPDADMQKVASELSTRPALFRSRKTKSSGPFNRFLKDGRTIAVSEEPMEDGARVVTYEDITERQRAEARLFHMARHDALTGLPNRVLFREEVERGLQHVRRGGALAILCIDLDRFKDVNDTLGHPIGDALLRQTADRLLRASGESTTVVRLGGDEFAIILYAEDRAREACPLAARLIAELSMPFEVDAHHISISASIGIAQSLDGRESPDILLKNADLALYHAKADGRATYRFFEQEMDVAIQAKRSLEVDLRAALTANQLKLFYQPLINAKTGTIVAFEALLRWHHAGRGMVSPVEFIPLAEETGLIHPIGRFVIDQACRDAMSWPDHVKVAVNLSPLQFRDADLVTDISAALRRSGLPADRLEVEITESLMLQDSAATLSKLHALRALGIRVSMDDFGTGYSSLSYLRRFPFDKVKIDRSFVANMDEGSDGLAIVRSAIALGRSLRMTVVAEGVETEDQMNLLREAGCQEVQGYLFSRPQPASALDEIIDRFSLARVA